MDDDVFLQDIVVTKGFVSGVKQMQVFECRAAEYKIAERPVIRAVAEAAGYDRDKLSAFFQQIQRQRDKSGIEVHRFDADAAQCRAVRRIAPHLLVGRVQDRVRIPWQRTCEKVSRKRRDRRLDKILTPHRRFAVHVRAVGLQRPEQMRLKTVVDLEGIDVDPAKAQLPRNASVKKGC